MSKKYTISGIALQRKIAQIARYHFLKDGGASEGLNAMNAAAAIIECVNEDKKFKKLAEKAWMCDELNK